MKSLYLHFIYLKPEKVIKNRLLAMTAREFLQRHNNIELLKLINEVYEDSSETEPMVTMMQSNQLEVFSLHKVRGEIS